MSNKRKARLFDEFVFKLASYSSAYRVIQCLEGSLHNYDVFNSDYEQVWNDFLEPLTKKEVDEILMKILPKAIEQDLGAKKVSIKW